MARDLIPPRSPAGRPVPDGTPHLIELPPEQPGRQPPPGPSQFRNRFGFMLGALGGVILVASILFVTVVVNGRGAPAGEGLAADWSAWQPPDDTLDDAPREIAERIGAEYAHPDGRQLVLVMGSPMLAPVALRPSVGPIEFIQDKGELYQLNGLGPNNSIKGGTPSAERLQLIKREALELALYTFRYVPDAEMVVALLPPPPPAAGSGAAAAATPAPGGQLANAATPAVPRTAIFYRPGDLKAQLQVPLGATVPSRAPAAALSAGELGTVELLTQANMFEWAVQESTGLLVLDRPAP
jgi:hypothetical protein